MADLLTEDDLLDRLFGSEKQKVFVVGSAICAPAVPDSAKMVQLALEWYENRPRRRRLMRRQREPLSVAANRLPPYQQYRYVFGRLVKSIGVDKANELVQKAVKLACEPGLSPAEADERPTAWKIEPAVAALGRYAANRPDDFSNLIVTSNFDPLIEMSIELAGGQCARNVMTADGHLQPIASGVTQVVHVHGYWRGTDTLHTDVQHQTSRPALRTSLKRLFRCKEVVVLGFGGADGEIVRALKEIVREAGAKTNVLWAFHGEDVEQIKDRYADVFDALHPAVGQQRAMFYQGVDVHRLLPQLAAGIEPQPFQDPDEPVARENLIKHVLKRIEDGASTQLIGEPHMGKTAVLRKLERMLRSRGKRVAYIDARGVARTPAHFVQAVGDALEKRVETWGLLSEKQAVPDEAAAREALRALLPCVVLVDDADELAMEGHGFSGDFFTYLRTLDGLVWVSASAGNLVERFNKTGVSSPFLNNAEEEVVGALEPSVKAALARIIEDEAAVEAILAEAGPHAVPLTWWAQHADRGSVESLRTEFRAWIASLYAAWWPEERYAQRVLKGAADELRITQERARIMRARMAVRGVIHESAAWWAYVRGR